MIGSERMRKSSEIKINVTKKNQNKDKLEPKNQNDEIENDDYEKTEGLNKEADYRNVKLSANLDKNIKKIIDMMGATAELKKRDFYLDLEKNIRVAFLYLNGLVDQNYINETIFDAMIHNYERFKDKIDLTVFKNFHQFIVTVTEMDEANTLGDLMMGLLGGDTILLIDGFSEFYILGTRKFPERAVSAPTTHNGVVGPKDSFTENILTNLNLIRRRIKNPNLWLEKFYIGTDSNTDVFMIYLKGIAPDKLVTEVYNRLKSVKLENVIDSSYIEGTINENKFSIFPTLYTSERPDVISANLFEGRVAVLVDGSPFVLIAPTVFIQFLQSSEDFYQKSYVTVFNRMLRFVSFYISILLPAIYVAVVLVNPEILPFQLLVKIAGQREGLPFPSYIEAFIMCMIFDVLREAGIRAPLALGSSITTAGALVLGQSAVQAGIISPVMVVIVSITGITTLTIPNYRLQIKMAIIKYPFIILGAMFGIFGLLFGLMILFIHLCSVRSFGVSYYKPFSPFNKVGQMDSILDAPIRTIFKRPKTFAARYKDYEVKG